MLKRSIMVILIALSCNVYASQQPDRHSGEKAIVGTAATLWMSLLTKETLEISHLAPKYGFGAGVAVSLTGVTALYTVNKVWQYRNCGATKE